MQYPKNTVIPIRESIQSGLKHFHHTSQLLELAIQDTTQLDTLENLRSIRIRCHKLINDAESIVASLPVIHDCNKAGSAPANNKDRTTTLQPLQKPKHDHESILPNKIKREVFPKTPIVALEVYWDLAVSQGQICVKFEYRTLDGQVVKGICSPGILSTVMRNVLKRIRSVCGRKETPIRFTPRRSGKNNVPRDKALAFIDQQIERCTWKKKFSVSGELAMWASSREHWESSA